MSDAPIPNSTAMETTKHTAFAVLISCLICALAYAVLDPTLFHHPIALILPVVCPLVIAPPLVQHLLRSSLEVSAAKALADTRSRQFEAMIEERDRILNLVGHDLADHIGIISSFAAALGQPKVSDANRLGQSAEIERAAAMAQDVLRELMVWGRLTIADEETRRRPVDGRGLIDRVVELTRGLAAAKGIFMEGIGQPIHVSVDSRQIEGALRNLVGNAIQHTQRDGTIVLSIDFENDGSVAFTVRDNGDGIRPDVLRALRRGETQNLVKRDGDLDNALKPSDAVRTLRGRARSTGLGLALCREVAERHGGTLVIESSPGNGTTVALRVSSGDA